MVVGKKTSKNKKCKLPQSSTQHQPHQQQSSSSADCLKDDVPLTGSVPRELHQSAIELGYNSGDEYERSNSCNFSAKEIDEAEKRFEKKMRKKGFIIKKMAEDGACLFRAVADQIYGDQEMHQALRKLCMDYMAKNSDYFSHYVTEDFSEYIKRKRLNSCHGNHVEIQALSEMFNRPIEVYHYNSEPINFFQGCSQTDNEPIRLSYHQNVHYNSVVDPYKATIGIGLGFPSFKPGLADKNLLDKAIRISEEQELEQVMLQDKMKMTDWEATNEAIEEQIARESYVEWLKENERRLSKSKKAKFTAATATATTTTTSSTNNLSSLNNSPKWGNEETKQKSPKLSPRLSPKLSPKACSSGLSNNYSNNYNNFVETGTFVNQLPPQMFGINDWDDGDILRQVLAQSQQEYLDSLKRKAKEISSESNSLANENRASSSGLNFHEDNGCSSNGSPNKKLKLNNNKSKLDISNFKEFDNKSDQFKEEEETQIKNDKVNDNLKEELKNDDVNRCESVKKNERLIKDNAKVEKIKDLKENQIDKDKKASHLKDELNKNVEILNKELINSNRSDANDNIDEIDQSLIKLIENDEILNESSKH